MESSIVATSRAYVAPALNLRTIDIARINSELDIAIQSKSMVLSDKLKISLVLVERMTAQTVRLTLSKIKNIGVLTDVVLRMLNEARDVSLNDSKRTFLALAMMSVPSSYMVRILNETIETRASSLATFVENTIDCVTSEYVDELLRHEQENIIFNIMRKTVLSDVREYIFAHIDSIRSNMVKTLMRKEYEKLQKRAASE